jgi:hypothetical protein
MNWYLIVAIVAAGLLGWAIGILIGTKKGYFAALEDYREQLAQQQWLQYFSQLIRREK